MAVSTDKKQIEKIFNRGIVTEILPSKEAFLNLLLSGKKLRIYIGADPTSNSLHLSHAKNYMFLEELRKLGHEVIVLFGDFTAQIGDPSGRKDARPQLTRAEVKKNVKDWVKQIKPLMSFGAWSNPPRILLNSTWLEKLSFVDVVSLASNFTVQQMLERDMFDKRLQQNVPIHLHEFLYPLMQGYDSVAMDVDVELCGTDQTFNALAGRTLLKRMKNKEKFVIALNLMENPKTGELMSKSRGTGVFLSSSANEMYGAIMSQPDEMTEVFFINNTRIPLEEKNAIMALGPRNAKARVALEIVKIFHGEWTAQKAADNFDKQFKNKELPEEIEEITIDEAPEKISSLIHISGLTPSTSTAQQLLKQGGIRINQKKVETENQKVESGDILQVGPRKFKRIIIRGVIRKKTK